MKQMKAFTLLEILLVIAAIGILAAIVIVAINPQRQLAQVRDAERQSSINTLAKALDQYLIDEGGYPEEVSTFYQNICVEGEDTDCVNLSALVPTYLASIPVDPSGNPYQVAVNSANNGISLLSISEIEPELVINKITPVASGGTETIIEDSGITYRVHTFLESSTLDVTTEIEVEYLIVGGGGGGGNGRGGGGGAGGFLSGSMEITDGSYSIVVGQGGPNQSNGQNSSFNNQIAVGGGAGGTHISSNNGNNGGSGGGGAINYSAVIPQGGTATSGQGFNGAPGGSNTNDNPRNTGGGGGAGQAGTRGSSTTVPPKGGDGLMSSITGAEVLYAGGGGGAWGGSDRSSAGFGLGGLGGGGNGGNNIVNPTNGENGLGSGGGGGSASGASGGSGIVIVRYPI